MATSTQNYPGSKAGAGVWQRIISHMPAHSNYFELFLGHGAVIRRKRPAPGLNVGVDDDVEVINWWHRRPTSPGMTILQGNALHISSLFPAMLDPDSLVYLDPPYLLSTRTKLFYEKEFATERQHRRLLNMAVGLDCMVMISGYPSSLYATMLEGWRVVKYQTMTRGGPRTECLWLNFKADLPLHDTRWVGQGFRDRERIKRKKQRWVSRLTAMPPAERQVLREALADVDRSSSPASMVDAHSTIAGNGDAVLGLKNYSHPRKKMKRSLSIGWWACLSLIAMTSISKAAPLTIMPVGDSITVGYTDNPTWSVPYEQGYRGDLYQMLAGAGYNFNYVGNSPEPYNGAYGFPTNSPTFDLRSIGEDNMEGYAAEGTAFIAANLPCWLATYQPNIVLLDIGINDIGEYSNIAPTTAENGMLQIVQEFVADDPTGHLIVSQITPYAGYTNTIVQYNSWIANTLVPQYAADNVTTVDMYTGMLVNGQTSASMYANGINHPNATGYQNMADQYFSGIEAVVPVPEPTSLAAIAGLLFVGRRKRQQFGA